MDLTNAQYTKLLSLIRGSALVRSNFDTNIRTNLGFNRWESQVNKTGFAGISLSAPTTKSPAHLEVIWTTDGVNGFPLDLELLNKKSSLLSYIQTL